MILTYEQKTPDTVRAAFVAESAQLIGDVTLAEGSSVWYSAVLRGDSGFIRIGKNANIQDGAVLHMDIGGGVTVGDDVSVGHCAIVHGCTVGRGSLIGMHATLLNHCVVGEGCIIGAGALVPEGMVIPDGMLAVGVPARILRPVTDAQREMMAENTRHYTAEAARHAALV